MTLFVNYTPRSFVEFSAANYGEPLDRSQCPHRPGTPEHAHWIRTYVLDRQADSWTDASKAERARIAALIDERRERMDTEQARRSEQLDALIDELPPLPQLDADRRSEQLAEMIDELPIPGVDLPVDGLENLRPIAARGVLFGLCDVADFAHSIDAFIRNEPKPLTGIVDTFLSKAGLDLLPWQSSLMSGTVYTHRIVVSREEPSSKFADDGGSDDE